MFVVMTIRDNVPDNVISISLSRQKAHEVFLRSCSAFVPDWDEYTTEDKETLLDEGYIEFGDNQCLTYVDCSSAERES